MLSETPVQSCPVCGHPIGSGMPEGLCPVCLAREVMADSPGTAASGGAPDKALTGLRFFGDYELLEEVGRGGSGVVFKAQQLGVNRIVALKTLVGGAAAGREFVHRFHSEAATAASLNHPNIVPIYEFGEYEGTHFLAMRFMEGGTLQTCGPDRQAAGRAAGLMVTIAEAVQYAHQRGVLHRDLKPGNILIDQEGKPYVADFGLARVLETERDLTISTAILGTVPYLAPEIAARGASAATTASDIYGLGAILYELLVGGPPFTGPTISEVLRKVRDEEPLRPSLAISANKVEPGNRSEIPDQATARAAITSQNARGPDRIPPDLETICLKCLEKEPAKRYTTAQEFANDLARFLRDEPIQARPVTRLERSWRWCRRKPAVAGLVVALNLALALGLAGVLWQWRQALASELSARQHQYVSDMNLVQQSWQEGNLNRAQALLRAHIPKPGERDLRGFEWRYLWKLCQNESRFSFTNFPAEVKMALSPGGNFIAAGSGGVVKLLDYAGGRELATLLVPDDSSAITALAFSPVDTNVLATASGTALNLWNLTNRRITATITLSNSAVALAFSPDGTLLAAASGFEGTLELWRINEHLQLWRRNRAGYLCALAFAPDGKSLVSGSDIPALWDLTTGASLRFPVGHRGGIRALVFSPDGKLMATGAYDSAVCLWDFAERKLLTRLIAESAGAVTQVSFSPDGRWLVTGNEDSTVRLWDLSSRKQKAIYRGHQSRITSLTFSPDARSILSSSSDQTAKVWDIEPRSHEEILTTNKTWTTAAVFSPNGKRFVSIDSWQGVLTVWDVATWSRLADLTKPSTNAEVSVAFSPDGAMLGLVGEDRLIKLWDAATLVPRGVLTNDFDPVSLSFSADGRTLAVSGLTGLVLEGITNRLAFWDLTTRRKLNKLAAAAPSAVVVSFSHNGKWLAIGYLNGQVRLWDYDTERLLAEFKDQHTRIWYVAFSPDDKWLVAGGFDGAVYFYDGPARRAFPPLTKTSTWILGLCFTPDGKTLASAEGDGTIKLWNVATRQSALTLRGHLGAATGVSFSPDGKLLESCGADGTVRLWAAASVDEIPTHESSEK